MVVLYQHELTGALPVELYRTLEQESGHDTAAYTREIVDAVLTAAGDLDAAIDEASAGWPAHRLAPLERSILRIAILEIRNRPDVPVEVSIDEAVTLAKRFCSREAGALVNGILSQIAREGPGNE
jgi:N utilization substance protein B